VNTSVQKVSVIVPCRNEVEYIEQFVKSVSNQMLTGIDLEIIIADGMSDDGTRDKLKNILDQYDHLRVIDNPDRTTPAALNHAIRAAKGEIIIRMDVHSEYSFDYISECIQQLNTTGADNVGGAWHAKGVNYLQNAIALAFQSPFSSGGAGSHSLAYEGLVDTVYLGCWKKKTLEAIGLFDETFVRNQDDELNLRIVRSGGKIWQSPTIKSWYYPRASLLTLFKQYMQYGYWKVRVIQKHKTPASIRHLVPGIFIFSLIALSLLALFSKTAQLTLVTLLSCYILGTALATIHACRRLDQLLYLPILPFIFTAFHFGYGYGFLRGVASFYLQKRSKQKLFTELTR